uniref:Cullin family profile domain-containing protein n=1 Tax=viral metagenome TaxID=1070528 RepID=A0A6C0ACD9_9ZZZZ
MSVDVQSGIEILKPFGNVYISNLLPNTYFINKDQREKDNFVKISQIIDQVYNRVKPNLSKPTLDRILYTLVSNNKKELNQVIKDSVEKATNRISDGIQQLIIEEKFTIDNFIECFENYYIQSNFLYDLFKYYTTKIMVNNKSYFRIICEYMFYYSVINKTYNMKDGSNKFLYEVLTDYVKKTVTIPEKLNIIHSYFKDMSDKLGQEALTLFNIDVDSNFLTSLGDDNDFVKQLSLTINNSMINIFKLCTDREKNKQLIKEETSKLQNISSIVKNFSNKNVFYNYYSLLLRRRILSVSTDYKNESKVFDIIKQNNDGVASIKDIALLVSELAEQDTDNDLFKMMIAENATGMYSDKDIQTINTLRNNGKIKIMVGRDALWENIPDSDEDFRLGIFDIPKCMFESLYLCNKYKTRDIKWNYNNSLVVVNYNIEDSNKMINNYKIQMTIPQYLVLQLFKSKDMWTATDIAEELHMDIKKVGAILNSFIHINLICIDKDTVEENPEYWLYGEFSSPNKKISIVNTTQVKKQESSNKIDKMVILEKIITIIDDSRIDKDSLLLNIFEEFKNKVSKIDIQESIDFALKEEFIKEVILGNNTFYEVADDDDSDED